MKLVGARFDGEAPLLVKKALVQIARVGEMEAIERFA